MWCGSVRSKGASPFVLCGKLVSEVGSGKGLRESASCCLLGAGSLVPSSVVVCVGGGCVWRVWGRVLWLWLWLSHIEQSGTSRPLWLLSLLLLLLLCCNVRSKAASSSFLLPLLPVLATGACGFAASAPAGSCRRMPFEQDYDNTGLAEAARG